MPNFNVVIRARLLSILRNLIIGPMVRHVKKLATNLSVSVQHVHLCRHPHLDFHSPTDSPVGSDVFIPRYTLISVFRKELQVLLADLSSQRRTSFLLSPRGVLAR